VSPFDLEKLTLSKADRAVISAIGSA